MSFISDNWSKFVLLQFESIRSNSNLEWALTIVEKNDKCIDVWKWLQYMIFISNVHGLRFTGYFFLCFIELLLDFDRKSTFVVQGNTYCFQLQFAFSLVKFFQKVATVALRV